MPLGKNSVFLLNKVWTKYNEFVLGIRTGPESPIVSAQEPWRGEVSNDARHGDNWRYSTISYRNVRRILNVVNPGPEDVFYDIGCGMGRILCVAAQRPMRRCVGVELLEPLCQIARQNAANLRARKAPIQIIRGDAAAADLSEGTIYFMFNPFGPDTLRDTLENIRCSLAQKPRTVKVVYYHAKYQSVLERQGWLVKVHEFDGLGGHPATIWENQRSQDGQVFREATWPQEKSA